jgi:hypothetical protein
MTGLIDAALLYARLGYPVFPLAPRSKLPLIPAEQGGHGLHDATTDTAQIRAWWEAHPIANIGLRTGVSFDVIDLDSEAAVDALEAARDGRERVAGPVVATGKGFHYFMLPTGLGNRASVLPGVDFRGQGGYVVAPPSEHPSGTRYRWIVQGRLQPAPSWLPNLLVPERPQIVSDHPRAAVINSSAFGRAALRRHMDTAVAVALITAFASLLATLGKTIWDAVEKRRELREAEHEKKQEQRALEQSELRRYRSLCSGPRTSSATG